MIKYRIIDLQFASSGGRYFADGALFDTKEDIRQQLISFHEVDSTDPEKLSKFTLDEVLNYGEWEIEEVEVNNCPYCKSDFEITEGHNCDVGRTS